MNTTPETPTKTNEQVRLEKKEFAELHGRGPQCEHLDEQIRRVLCEHWWTSHPSGAHREMAHLLYALFGSIPPELLKGPAFVYNTAASKVFAERMRVLTGGI